MISKDGKLRSRTSISTVRSSSLPSRNCWRSFSRVRLCDSPPDEVAPSSTKPPVELSAGLGVAGGRRISSKRSSALSSALSATSSSFSSRTISMASSTRSRTMDSTSRPTYPTSVNLEASTLRNGEFESLARRRAISVLPTPVGPIMMMFLGMISSASSGVSFWRRMRFRKAMATARLAAFWPTTYLSSSATISRGVSSSSMICSSSGVVGRYKAITENLEFFDGHRVVREDAHFPGDLHGFFGDASRRKLGVLGERGGGGLGKRAAAADGGDAGIGFDDVALATQQKRSRLIGNQQQRLEMAKIFVGAPVFGQFYSGTAEVAMILLQLGFETAKERECVGSGSGKPREDSFLIQAADFLGFVLDDRFAQGDLSVARHHDLVIAADAKDGGRA